MVQITVEKAVQAESSMNKFSRLFEERQIAAPSKAKDQTSAPVEKHPLAKTIGAAAQAADTDQAKQSTVTDSATVTDTKSLSKQPENPKSGIPVRLKPKVKSRSKAKSKPKSDAPRKRGRPANGKRSDPNWYGRTFYIRKQTDEQLEDALRKLKRSGIEIDKSQLVDALLNAWANVELGSVEDFQIGEILEKPNTD